MNAFTVWEETIKRLIFRTIFYDVNRNEKTANVACQVHLSKSNYKHPVVRKQILYHRQQNK